MRPQTATQAVFAAARIDPTRYLSLLERYQRNQADEVTKINLNPSNLRDITLARMNLFLLAGKSAEARALAERTLALSPPDTAAAAAADLARAQKAESRNLSRANAWVQRASATP